MTAITRNLPWFIRDLGVSIVGQHCYKSLVEDLDISDVKCIKYSVSKGLGIGIVVGGSIMKVPQLMLIISARSARGLSLPAYILETLSYAITLAYAARSSFPFSTYGENLFLTFQNAIITLLIISLPSPSLRRSHNIPARLFTATLFLASAGAALALVPHEALALLQLATLPLSLFSKLPQIRQNARARSTGQLSTFAVGSQVAGCLARLFTTAAEVGDMIVAAGFALALLLNCVLAVQMWMYWGKDEREKEHETSVPLVLVSEREREKTPSWAEQEKQGTVDIIVPSRSPMSHAGLQPSGRKWARKVD